MSINTFESIKKILKILILLSIFSIILIIVSYLLDNKIINDIKDFTSNGTKVLYISTKDKYKNKPIEFLKKYEVEYQYVDSSNLSSIERRKIQRIINSKNLDNIIVIYNRGVVLDALIDYETDSSLVEFFQKNNVIPEIIGKNDEILESVSKFLEEDYMVLYLPYKYLENIESEDEVLRNITERYNIKYKLINAYLLSETQKTKLNSILQVSDVQDQIIILIKASKIVGGIRGFYDESHLEYELKKYEFIDLKNYIEYIKTYDDFDNVIKSEEKNIVTIIKDDCRYCNDVLDKLNEIASMYSINAHYINISVLESDLSKSIQEKLNELNYEDSFTTPLTLIVESNKIIDYIIGASDEDYFIDVLKENGLIKR